MNDAPSFLAILIEAVDWMFGYPLAHYLESKCEPYYVVVRQVD